MSLVISKELLKEGIDELFIRDKITKDLKHEAYEFIDNISNSHSCTINYIDFRQSASTNITFDDNNRVASYISDGSSTAMLVTNQIKAHNILLLTLKLKGADENVNYEFSYNLNNWYNINSYDINEIIKDDFYLRISFTASNSITGLVFIFNYLDKPKSKQKDHDHKGNMYASK
ncbi:MAG: hypothetical protein ABSG25_15090 [Bryobacteraceae bacterium]